ncbi:VOC family protein [Sporosarcina sp. BI001-red]|uniref:VOC family protein n=1 Tax=Sporosarcina sp. BI001-red TaxID=2282866 RepID=UPI000E26B80D|nr:VOC family protein [Sporosarcina sp. BI001-red]REB11648.1 VOC family protein [Sporosarcina sp. BI001-red]
MNSPITNKINTIFVHVSDLENSVKWYSQLLGQDYDLASIERPVYNIKIADYTGLTLDAGPKGITKEQTSNENPLFNFHTENIDDSYTYVKELGYKVKSEIVRFNDFSFFTILDPDRNAIMICTG